MGEKVMPENLIDTIRSRIEAIKGQGTSGQRMGIMIKARERLERIRSQGTLAQGGIAERVGERFPALKRVRGQLEPFQRPALFERGKTEASKESVHVQEIAGGRVMQPPEKAAIF